MNNVVLICDEKSVLESLKSNLTLLRKFDSVLCCNFLNADKIIEKNPPQIIILYSNIIDAKIKELVKNINNNIPIIYIADELSDEHLLTLYEMGITDYLTTDSSQTEFLIKVISCLKKRTEKIKNDRNTEILEQIGIIKKGTNFYSAKYTPAVLKKFIQKYSKSINLTIMALAPDINIKNKYSLDYLAAILRENLREEDIIGFQADKLYVLLPNTNKQGALDLYNKIKKTFNDDYTICAGIFEIKNTMDYKTISQKTDEALEDALIAKNSVVVQENYNTGMAMNWLDKSNKKSKNFKLFKKALLKKIENAITPVFYQKQQMVEQRLFEVEVEQFSNEKESRFTLKKDGKYSIFEITYPGAVKLDFYIYKNINKVSEPEYQSFELPKVNAKLISDMLDKFIKDFDA